MLDFLLYHLFLALGVLLTLFLIAQILRDPRPPAASLAWLLFIVALPYLAIPIYLAIGVRKLSYPQKEALYSGVSEPLEHSRVADLDRLLDSYGIPTATRRNRVRFHATGDEALHALWQVIDSAAGHLDICIFILADDEVGDDLCRRLVHKVQQGVQVRLLLDGVGSFLLPREKVRRLREYGVRVRWFIPVLHRPFRGRTNLRNHRKLVIADGSRLWTGGRNLAAEYFDSAGHRGRPWLDMSFDLEGEGAAHYQELFEADWVFAGGHRARRRIEAGPVDGRATVRLLPSGPDMPDDPLQALLLAACFEARDRIVAVTPYFIPDEALLEGLSLTARRGVEVMLILPEKSNHALADIARGRYLRQLAAAGARIRLLPGAMNHAKALVMDDRLAMCGSANLDLRSLYLNFEVMSLFYDRQEVRWLEEWMQDLADRSIVHHPRAPGTLRALLEGLVVMLSFQL